MSHDSSPKAVAHAASHVSLEQILTLRPRGNDCFSGPAVTDGGGRLFGGHAIAQAIVAASETAGERFVRSFQISFLRPGMEECELTLAVHRLVDGRRLVCRQVEGFQHSTLLFTATVLFGGAHIPGTVTMPEDGVLDQLPPIPLRTAVEHHRHHGLEVPVQAVPRYARTGIRFVDDPPRVAAHIGSVPERSRSYCDFREFDLTRSVAALGYASDLSLLDPLAQRAGLVWNENAIPSSLTHTITVHRPELISDYLLFDRQLVSAAGGIATASAGVYSRAGIRVASIAQNAVALKHGH